MRKTTIVLTALIIIFLICIVIILLLPNPEGLSEVGNIEDFTIAQGDGKIIETNIETPHPYPNSNGERKVVWSEKISYNSTKNHERWEGEEHIYVHFKKIELSGKIETPLEFNETDYGPCLKDGIIVVEEFGRKVRYKTKEYNENSYLKILLEDEFGEKELRSELVPCGKIKEYRDYFPKEIFEKNFVKGDFILIRDKEREIIDIIAKIKPIYPPEANYYYLRDEFGWSWRYATNEITIELYSDNESSEYGILIDKYIRGLTEEEYQEKMKR